MLERGSNTECGAAAEEDKEEIIIKAHRVIVAARCDWFRRALLSGMKESIDRYVSSVRQSLEGALYSFLRIEDTCLLEDVIS